MKLLNIKQNIPSIVSTVLLWTLIILKVTNNIAISWLWVFSPIWLPVVLVIIGGLIIILIDNIKKII